MTTIKRLTMLPWRDAPFQKQYELLRSAYKHTKDLYLTSSNSHEDGVTEYQIKNDNQEFFLYVKCKSDNGIPRLIEIFSPETDRTILEVKELKPFWYSVLQDESTIGTLLVQKDRFCFLDPHNQTIYLAISVTGDDADEQIVDLESIPGLYYKIELHLAIKEENGNQLGKYFRALHNLDLSQDRKLQLDRSIAVAFAVLFEEVVRIPPPRVSVYK